MQGKTALVTGGARRIGAAVVRALARAEVRVVIHCNTSREAAEALAAEVGGQVVAADLAADAAGAWAQAHAAAGPIDFLINNASLFPEDRIEDFTLGALESNIRLHAWAPLVLGRALAAQGRAGGIINLLDSRVTDFDSTHVPYHISKRVLHDLTRMMALAFAPQVRVNAVAPGLILPPEGKEASYLEALAETNPLHAVGSPEDIADGVIFLLQSAFVTGQTLYVDGGRHMRGQVYG